MTISKQWLGLALWILISLGAGALGGMAGSDPAFYGQLDRPGWAPPAGVFGPVWGVLYLLMGLGAWLVWRKLVEPGAAAGKRVALGLFVLQLAFNAGWTWIFFNLQDGAAAFAQILILWALILATLVAFWRIVPAAGALLVPYLGWVTFAAALTFDIWQRNPALLT